jgi:hypothetical protein
VGPSLAISRFWSADGYDNKTRVMQLYGMSPLPVRKMIGIGHSKRLPSWQRTFKNPLSLVSADRRPPRLPICHERISDRASFNVRRAWPILMPPLPSSPPLPEEAALLPCAWAHSNTVERLPNIGTAYVYVSVNRIGAHASSAEGPRERSCKKWTLTHLPVRLPVTPALSRRGSPPFSRASPPPGRSAKTNHI